VSEVFLHIGLHKTGTTYLQKKVFPLWPGIKYLKRSSLVDLVEIEAGSKILISNEEFSGYPYGKPGKTVEVFRRNIVNLSRYFPNAKVLISLRRHDNFMVALYQEYLHEGGILTFDEFYSMSGKSGCVADDILCFYERLQIVEELFPHRPFVFLQEELKENPDQLFRSLASHLGTDVPVIPADSESINPGVGYYQASLLRKLNKLSRSHLNPHGILNYYVLNNPTLSMLGLTPKQVCQRRLSFFKRRIKLNERTMAEIRTKSERDWNKILDYIKATREILL
jgi:hypothetical protein